MEQPKLGWRRAAFTRRPERGEEGKRTKIKARLGTPSCEAKWRHPYNAKGDVRREFEEKEKQIGGHLRNKPSWAHGLGPFDSPIKYCGASRLFWYFWFLIGISKHLTQDKRGEALHAISNISPHHGGALAVSCGPPLRCRSQTPPRALGRARSCHRRCRGPTGQTGQQDNKNAREG